MAVGAADSAAMNADSDATHQVAQADTEFVVLSDDVLTSVANATNFLLEGNEVEKLAVLYQFPQFLEHCPTDSVDIMVPEITAEVVNWAPSVQMAAAEALYFVVTTVITPRTAKLICVAALRIVDNCPSGEVFDAWGEILSMTLPQVTRADVTNLVVPSIQSRVDSPNPEARRLVARSIGALSQPPPNAPLAPDEVEELFLGAALRLCGDEDASVRAMIAQSLAALGAELPMRVCEGHLWPKLEVLLRDENSRVRAAALRALSRSAEAHAKEHAGESKLYETLLAPLFKDQCRLSSKVAAQDLRTVDDDTYLMLEVFSEVYGLLLVAVAPVIEEDESAWKVALSALRAMVTCNGPTVRHWCSYNLPAVAVTCGSKRHGALRGVVQAMAGDSDVETRATLAAGIHEVTEVLARSKLRYELVQGVGLLMTDSNNQVRVNALQNFAHIVELLLDSAPPGEPSQLGQIFQSLELMSQEGWRTQEILAHQLDQAAHIIPQELLCEHVATVCFQMARESTYLVRKASINALVKAARYISDVRRRDHLLEHFRKQWARGKVYWTRVAYIDGAERAYELFSSQLFNQIFASELVAMVDDPVANVRLRLVRLFRQIAPLSTAWSTFPDALDRLCEDKDSQVAQESKALRADMPHLSQEDPEWKERDLEKLRVEKTFFVVRKKSMRRDKERLSSGFTTSSNTQATTSVTKEQEVVNPPEPRTSRGIVSASESAAVPPMFAATENVSERSNTQTTESAPLVEEIKSLSQKPSSPKQKRGCFACFG